MPRRIVRSNRQLLRRLNPKVLLSALYPSLSRPMRGVRLELSPLKVANGTPPEEMVAPIKLQSKRQTP